MSLWHKISAMDWSSLPYLATMLATSPLLSGGNHLCAAPLATAYTETKARPWQTPMVKTTSQKLEWMAK